MKIYFYRIRIFLSNENIFLSNENNFYRMQIYFYRMKIIFIEFCYISATIEMCQAFDALRDNNIATSSFRPVL